MSEPVGIDVGAKRVTVSSDHAEFSAKNDLEGHQEVIKRLTQGHRRTVRVVMESTGTYTLDLALALHAAKRVEVMVVNPRAVRHFAMAIMRRSKDDPIDARVQREFARRMKFTPWQPPPKENLELRTLARRSSALTEMKTEEKNRLHAANSTETLECIREDIEESIQQLEQRIKGLTKRAAALVNSHPRLQVPIARLISTKGIGFLSAFRIYGELGVLPTDMTASQWVAHAGLDPRHFESGTLTMGKTRISKAGNKYLRAALYFPAVTAAEHQANVRAFYQKLLAKGKEKMVATVAVMRKLLHAIWGMLKHDADFDGEKFYRLAG
ncbi:MAG: IS110 family transposase [Gemmatimonadota bacterium]|nr:MAG: IS110 family transposase [Gemmatimonadota bacterium]